MIKHVDPMAAATGEGAAAGSSRPDPGSYGPALVDHAGLLDGQMLLEKAARVTGLADWGGFRWNEERFRHDFDLLCRSIEDTSELSRVGRTRSHSRLFTMLVSRLRYIDARKATAAVDSQPIVAPLIGTGLPRAGTTFLHGLLAQDPANRIARSYEAAIPVPYPTPGRDHRRQLYDALLQFGGLMNEAVASIHPYISDQPDECIFIQEGDCGSLANAYWHVPAFQQATADKGPSALAWQVGLMQYWQATKPGGRWALKAPGHLFGWAELQMAFPDALIYVNHRDPAKVIPSVAGLFLALRRTFSDSASNPIELGTAQLAAWSQAMNRYLDWRSDAGRDADVVDVHFADLIAQPLETVAALYDRLGISFSETAREAMSRHLETDHHGKGPVRPYTLAEFGLSEEAVEAAFGRYLDHFGIKREKRA